MTDEPTAWQDINPPMVSAQPQEQPSPCSDRTKPADATTFRNELTACLSLVAPVGMTEEAKRDWLMVAWDTLKHLPADLLRMGCRKAREVCDHPSKVVPVIVAETRDYLNLRRAETPPPVDGYLSAPEPEYVTAEQAASILAEFGLKRDLASFSPDEAP